MVILEFQLRAIAPRSWCVLGPVAMEIKHKGHRCVRLTRILDVVGPVGYLTCSIQLDNVARGRIVRQYKYASATTFLPPCNRFGVILPSPASGNLSIIVSTPVLCCLGGWEHPGLGRGGA